MKGSYIEKIDWYFLPAWSSCYSWNSFIYVGKDAIATSKKKEMMKKLVKSGAVVPKVMDDVFRVGYQLYVNNCYISEKLFYYLWENQTAACSLVMVYWLKVKSTIAC